MRLLKPVRLPPGDVAGFAQSLAERGETRGAVGGPPRVEVADHRHRLLLAWPPSGQMTGEPPSTRGDADVSSLFSLSRVTDLKAYISLTKGWLRRQPGLGLPRVLAVVVTLKISRGGG